MIVTWPVRQLFPRLENSATARDIYRLAQVFVDQFIASYDQPGSKPPQGGGLGNLATGFKAAKFAKQQVSV